MRRLLALIVAAALACAVPAQANPVERKVIADGHVDLGPRFIDGAWIVQVRDDTAQPAVWRDLSTVVLHAVDASAMTVPPDAAFAFLGNAGAKVWVLPQVQQAGILWPGWNTQDPTVLAKVNREVTWVLHGVSGPGHFTLFLNGDFGAPQAVFDSDKPFPQEIGIEPASHVHGNWAFSAPGSYVLDIELTASTVDSGQVRDRRPLRIFVGPGDPATAFPTVTSSSAPPAAPAAQAVVTPAEPAGGTPWLAFGSVLAVLVIGAAVLLWLRRNRSRGGRT